MKAESQNHECGQFREQLSALFDGELTKPDTQRVTEHLEHCPRCMKQLESIEKMSQVLRLSGRDVPFTFDWTSLES